MNVAELNAEIGRLLNDPQNQRWTTDVLLSRMNDAMTDILMLTNSVKTLETLTPVASTHTVQLSTNVIDVIRVNITRTDGNIYKLRGFLRDQLDFEDPNWQQRTEGEPICYWWDGTNQQINLVPAPDADNAIASGLRVWEIQTPTDLVNTTDIPFDSNAAMIPYHGAIVHYVVATCWMDDGTPEALGKSKFHMTGTLSRPGMYESEIMKINSKFDTPEDIPSRILWRPEGGRASKAGVLSKSNPLNI
jgi:hypothetical protein